MRGWCCLLFVCCVLLVVNVCSAVLFVVPRLCLLCACWSCVDCLSSFVGCCLLFNIVCDLLIGIARVLSVVR